MARKAKDRGGQVVCPSLPDCWQSATGSKRRHERRHVPEFTTYMTHDEARSAWVGYLRFLNKVSPSHPTC